MIDRLWPDAPKSVSNGFPVEQIDGVPRHQRRRPAFAPGALIDRRPRRGAAWTMPGDDGATPAGQQVEEMTAGKSGGPGHQRDGRLLDRGRSYRGTPVIPPLNGEKLPSPASVNERKKRWSAGTVDA